MNKIFKKISIYHLYAFIIPAFIFLFLYIVKGSFINKVFLHADAGFQYLGEFYYLKDVMNGNNSFPYTFSFGLGGTLYGTFFYILSSPLNILLYLFDDVILFMFIVTILKIGLCGLNMFIYLNKRFDKKYSLIFSLCYSLSAYIVMYHTNLMWLDSIMYAPLVIYGVEKIIDEDKDTMFIVFLLLALISNYYIGYQIALFSAIYFMYYLYINNTDKSIKEIIKNNRKKIIHYIVLNILIGLTISFILIPSYYESLSFIRTKDNRLFNFALYDLLAGTYSCYGLIEKPVNFYVFIFYCGVLINMLLLMYLMDNSINKKEKRAVICVLLTLFLSIFIIPLNKIWHLTTYPLGFNYRFSFLYLIFILPILIKYFKDHKIILNSKIKIACLIYLILSISFVVNDIIHIHYMGYKSILYVAITLLIMLFNIILIKKENKNKLLALLVIDLIINISVIFGLSYFTSTSKFNHNYNETKNVLSNVDSNYRVGMLNSVGYNDGLLLNVNSIGTFNSNTNYRSIRAIRKVYNKDYDGEYYYFFYNRYNVIADSLLGVKYIGFDRINHNYNLLAIYDINGERYFMENPYAFSIGYVADKKIKKYKYKDSIYYINDLLNSISGKDEDFLIPIDIEKIDDKKYAINDADKYDVYYLVFDGSLVGGYDSYNDNNKYNNDYVVSEDYIMLYNDTLKKKITIDFEELNSDFEVYVYDIDKFKEYAKDISRLDIISNKGNSIKGTIDSDKDGVLLFTIPYESGWTIYLDGKEVKYYEVLDGLIGVDITKGSHKIELKYRTPLLNVSIIISSISLLALIIIEIIKKRKGK